MTSRLRRLALIASAWALFGGLLARPAAAQEEPEHMELAAPAPKPDLPDPSTRVNLVITGFGMTAGFYGAALGSSLLWSNGAWAPDMRIPIVGPWMAMPKLGCGPGELNCGTALVAVRGVLAGLDAIGQVGGLAVALESLFVPVRKSAHAHARLTPKHAWVKPVPLFMGAGSIGLGFVGEL